MQWLLWKRVSPQWPQRCYTAEPSEEGHYQTLGIRNLHNHTGPTGTLQWGAATETQRGAAEQLQTMPVSVLHCSGWGRVTLEDTALKTRKSPSGANSMLCDPRQHWHPQTPAIPPPCSVLAPVTDNKG